MSVIRYALSVAIMLAAGTATFATVYCVTGNVNINVSAGALFLDSLMASTMFVATALIGGTVADWLKPRTNSGFITAITSGLLWLFFLAAGGIGFLLGNLVAPHLGLVPVDLHYGWIGQAVVSVIAGFAFCVTGALSMLLAERVG